MPRPWQGSTRHVWGPGRPSPFTLGIFRLSLLSPAWQILTPILLLRTSSSTAGCSFSLKTSLVFSLPISLSPHCLAWPAWLFDSFACPLQYSATERRAEKRSRTKETDKFVGWIKPSWSVLEEEPVMCLHKGNQANMILLTLPPPELLQEMGHTPSSASLGYPSNGWQPVCKTHVFCLSLPCGRGRGSLWGTLVDVQLRQEWMAGSV